MKPGLSPVFGIVSLGLYGTPNMPVHVCDIIPKLRKTGTLDLSQISMQCLGLSMRQGDIIFQHDKREIPSSEGTHFTVAVNGHL